MELSGTGYDVFLRFVAISYMIFTNKAIRGPWLSGFFEGLAGFERWLEPYRVSMHE